MVNITEIISKAIVNSKSLLASLENTNLLNDDSNNSVAMGGKTKPNDEKKNEMHGGKNPGKLAFFLNIFVHVNIIIMKTATKTIYIIIAMIDASSWTFGGIK